MLNFEQACETLKVAETKYDTSRQVDYGIRLQFCSNRSLQEKIYAKYKKKPEPASSGQLPKLCDVGCCEIDHLTDSEVFRFFSEIFERNDISQTGKCLYLSINDGPCAAILYKSGAVFFPMLVTMPPPKHLSKFRYMFSKLFDDVEVEKQKNGEWAEEYSEEMITRLRSDASRKISKFLKRKIANFPLFPFGNAFLGLMFD